jgi:hypothetical protein
MYAYDTNVDACKPGDKITITGEPCSAAEILNNAAQTLLSAA